MQHDVEQVAGIRVRIAFPLGNESVAHIKHLLDGAVVLLVRKVAQFEQAVRVLCPIVDLDQDLHEVIHEGVHVLGMERVESEPESAEADSIERKAGELVDDVERRSGRVLPVHEHLRQRIDHHGLHLLERERSKCGQEDTVRDSP